MAEPSGEIRSPRNAVNAPILLRELVPAAFLLSSAILGTFHSNGAAHFPAERYFASAFRTLLTESVFLLFCRSPVDPILRGDGGIKQHDVRRSDLVLGLGSGRNFPFGSGNSFRPVERVLPFQSLADPATILRSKRMFVIAKKSFL
jgi:hypothetical protein